MLEKELSFQSEFSSDEMKQMQEAQAYLRERFLRAITKIVGHSCEIQMCDGINVSGDFRGSDFYIEHFFAKQFKTPGADVLPYVKLRASDIIKIHIPEVNLC